MICSRNAEFYFSIRSRAGKQARSAWQLDDFPIDRNQLRLRTFRPFGHGSELLALGFRCRRVHFEEPRSGFNGLEVDVRIAKAAQQRQTQGFQKTLERFEVGMELRTLLATTPRRILRMRMRPVSSRSRMKFAVA